MIERAVGTALRGAACAGRPLDSGWCTHRAHRGDLQAIGLPDASLDVVLTPHAPEHVPDTDRALAESWRVMRPGGKVFIQAPQLQGTTSVPAEPERHGGDTLVHGRFGWDLTDRISGLGFVSTLLVPEDFRLRSVEGRADWETRRMSEIRARRLLGSSPSEDQGRVSSGTQG